MKMYCLTTQEDHYEKIKKLGYLPVGLGKAIKSKDFISDNTKLNISNKNPFSIIGDELLKCNWKTCPPVSISMPILNEL